MVSLDAIDEHSEVCAAPKALSLECFGLGVVTQREPNGKPYSVYQFMLVCQCQTIRWTFTKRFSDFVTLHKQLSAMTLTHEEAQLMIRSQVELPPLPQKVLFGSMEPAVILSRQAAFEGSPPHTFRDHGFRFNSPFLTTAYTKALVQQYSLPRCTPLADFVKLPSSLGGTAEHAGMSSPFQK
jgi:hypothetical protein